MYAHFIPLCGAFEWVNPTLATSGYMKTAEGTYFSSASSSHL
jgi:hypothetical protein